MTGTAGSAPPGVCWPMGPGEDALLAVRPLEFNGIGLAYGRGIDRIHDKLAEVIVLLHLHHEDLAKGPLQNITRAESQNPAGRIVEDGDPALGIQGHDPFIHTLDDALVKFYFPGHWSNSLL